ncbi:MAG: AAA family ATPase, partial [Bacteroidota bacterium]
MNLDLENINFKLAYDFINHTNCSLYLTGKAGTGKTTFLKYVKQHCRKNLVIVAPTGVAAINAGGVTMHSFFQLPFGPYLPDMKTG